MNKKTLVGFFLMALCLSGRFTFAEEIQSQNFKQLSSLYTYNDTSPYISGNFVVWGAKSTSMATARHVMLFDLVKNKEIQITTNNFENSYPAVDGDLKLVVYLSVRNGLYGLYLCEYNPQDETCPEVKLIEDANYKFYTEIDGNRIVWVEYASTAPYRRIYACDYDFAGHCPKELIAGGQNISRPNLEGDLLLWEDRTNYDGGTETEHLFLHDLVTGNTYDLDKGDNAIGDMAAIDGSSIIWAKQKYNVTLQRWERVLVRCQYTPQNAPNVCAMQEVDTTMGKSTLYAPASPSVSGKRVVYRNDLERDPNESVSINADIYHYNMETGEILRVTTESASQHMPMVSGNRLVWREVQPNNILLIRLYEFKMPNNPPLLGSIGNKTVLDSEPLSFIVSATDQDNQGLSFIHPLLQDLPPGATFNMTSNEPGRLEGVFAWTPAVDQSGSHHVLFEVSDGELFDSELVTIDVSRRLYCGDGIVSTEIGELCDSNIQSCTGAGYAGTSNCNSQCSGFAACIATEFCGDGIKNGPEECDGVAGVGEHQECSTSCTLIDLPYCGDGVVNGAEQCDGLAGIGLHQECSASCTLINLPYCGDGIVNGSEQCDGLDGVGLHQECSASCLVVNLPYCGDGILNGSEQCDGMAGVGEHQECTSACLLTNRPYCGDGIVNETEQCDGLAGVGEHQECSATCSLVDVPYCGDGILNGTEQCDGPAGVGEHQECLGDCTLVTLPSDPQFVVLTQSHTVYTGANLTFNIVAQDANGYNLDLQALEALPKNAAFSPDSTTFNADGTSSVDGTFSWTPGSRQVGTYTIHFEAADTGGSASTVSDPVTIKVVKPTTTKTRK